jgi:hypothetical protein
MTSSVPIFVTTHLPTCLNTCLHVACIFVKRTNEEKNL